MAATSRTRPLRRAPVANRLIDAAVLPGGRIATVESGRAYTNGWNYSGFDGHGYLVCIDGEPVLQCAIRFQALAVLADGTALHRQTAAGLAALTAKEARS